MSNSELSDLDKMDDKPSEAGKKIQHSVQSLLKQMEMTNEEIKYRMENFDNVDIGKEYLKYLKCTKCNKNFQQVINRGEPVGIHPLLGVLMCDSCCDYYGDGNFSLDSEGEDKYCRWCGEGGTIFACSKCICGFCNSCIERHFGVDELETVKNDDDWVCYFCNPKPLWCLRSICFLANEVAKCKREELKKKKEDRNVKRKRRKKESRENELSNTSSDSSSNDSSNSNKYHTKRKRLLRQREKVKRDESSSSEDEKENIDSKRKAVKSEEQSADNSKESVQKNRSESDTKNIKKMAKINCDKNVNAEFENKKSLVLEKFKSIWKLTRTITEVGLNSCRERLKNLSKSDNFRNLESLKKEHEELKSCMNILVSSLNTVSNSVDSIREDLTFESAKEERQIFQIQETKLKNFAKKYQEESNVGTSLDSDQDSARKELKVKKRNKMRLTRGKKNSMRDSVNFVKKRDSDLSSEAEIKGKNKSIYLISDSGSDEEKTKRNVESIRENKDEKNLNSNQEGVVKPLLKVKSFARMLDENLYDKNKAIENKNESNPVIIDLYNRDTDESENENRRIRVSSDGKNGISAKTSITKEKKSCEGNCEMKKNFRIKKKEMNKSSSDESERRKSVCKKKKKKLSSDDESKIKSPVKNGERGLSYENEEDKEKKSDDVKKEEKIIPLFDRSESSGSSGGENEKNKNFSECENKEKKKDLDVDKNKKSRLSVEGNSKEIESSEEEGENKDDASDKGDEKKKNLSLNEVKKVIENDSAKDIDFETDKNQGSSNDESEQKRKLSENSKSVDVEKKELSESNDSASEQEERVLSADETSRKRENQNSSGSRTKKSSDEEQKSRRHIRRKKKGKETLKASFEKYKRRRERFLNSKERCQSENDRDELKGTKTLESTESESEQKGNDQNIEKPRMKRILASSDEENRKETLKIKRNGEENSGEENQNQKSDLQVMKPSSDGTTSGDEMDHKIRAKIIKRRKINVVSSDSSEKEIKKGRKKRKENNSESSEDEDKKKRRGRKNIKKILKKDSLQVETKEALKNEEERKKRLKERQNLFKELFPEDKEEESSKHIILDFDPETKEPLVKVHKKLAKKLKPHQVKGVKFMWNNCFESVQKLEEESGSGCILAHCMGLGKTLQVITLVHTVMTHELGVNTTLIVCPLSTVSNWVREFEIWLENIHTDPITLYDMVKYKRRDERRFHLESWHQNGGVLVLSYDLFRTLTKEVLTNKHKKKTAKYLQAFEKTLLDPGPDLVICDEGHLLKNEDTALSKLISRIKTSRRIVLTGTPLQNNLIEYHCMVQFVKPNILGTKKEFCNRFVNPIVNGQFEDSTELDVKIMKKRSHVLHSMLDGCIQRFDYSVLTPFLPEKHEYVLSISLTETQAKVYLHFIKSLSAKSLGNSKTASLFNDYNNLQRIWTHPRAILMHYERESQKESLEDESEGSLKDFVVSSDEETSESRSESSNDSIQEIIPKKRVLRSNPEVKKALEEEEKFQEKHWWDEFYDEKAYDDLQESNKLVVLFSLLKYCRQAKDKVLVFSQSLYSLDLIEYFLSRINENSKKNNETSLCGHQDTWIPGSDYFRLDGSTKSELRAVWCKYFNEESNTRARLFLISTKAGGLGINLYGANRVVLFDVSWNPSHDLQSIFRVYRFGQKKPCYIYRFLAEATMEEKIYERQVTKLSLAHRVVDEHQIERHYSMVNLQELYTFEPTPKDQRKVPKLPKDSVLADLLGDHKDIIVGYHEHDSLLENKQEEELTEEERKTAWKEYEEEKAQKIYNFDSAAQQQMMLVQQSQYFQGGSGAQSMNPAYLGQMNAASTETELSQSSISFQVIRRFILSKGFESPFGLQLLANILSDIVQGCKTNQMSFEFPVIVKKQEEISEELVAKPVTKFEPSSELKLTSSNAKFQQNGDGDDVDDVDDGDDGDHGDHVDDDDARDNRKRESDASNISEETVLYCMNNSSLACDNSNKTVTEDMDVNKRDFFSSDSDSSSSSSNLEKKILNRKRRKKADEIPEKDNREGITEKSRKELDPEEKELEKLLLMTELSPNTRTRIPSSEEVEVEEKKGKEGRKDKKSLKLKQEISLLDCLGSDNCEGTGNPDLEEEKEERKEEEEEDEDEEGKPKKKDFFSLINDQIKKTFLLSSDESYKSSEEAYNEEKSEEKKKKSKKKERLLKKKRKDDLSEYRIPSLSSVEGKEASEKETTSETESTEKDRMNRENVAVSSGEESDDSIKCVQHVKKRKRMSTDDSGKAIDTDSEIQQEFNSKTESSPTKGRKNIKKILKKESLQIETKQALKMETERKKRVSERQKLFEALLPTNSEAGSKFVLDFDPQTKEELIVVDEKLSQMLKPHQKNGVQFMWNCCFESLKRLEEDSGSGCVLAHCMGLGKTLQVITLVHTILTHNTGVQTVLIICPLNTVRNWTHEFKKWQRNCLKKIKPVDLIFCKSRYNRMLEVRSWLQKGGVLVISYDMFRSLIKNDGKKLVFFQSFLNPGPDLVVCDEGHVLKNNNSAISKCLSQIKTLRRIILTGTPLQNNLLEYYCMVQFVKPNILGTIKEFKNRFVHPINNGQFEDSTELDVLLMKRRSHVLHTMLDGFIQRFGYHVLTPFLPEKQEYVISIALTKTQEKIYQFFIERCSQKNRGLLKDFHSLQKIWTHPRIMMMHSIKCDAGAESLDEWSKYVRDEEYCNIRSSGKLFLLLSILKRSKEMGDKVLVFSQSLLSLDLIEFFLRMASRDYFTGVQTEFAESWVFGVDYYRLDGSTKSENRDIYCRKFNDVHDKQFRLFLISTKAGGLGISLVAANRVVVFDASWNPTHDVQSIFRVYRFGQKKPCFIYRFLAAATMEEKIYKRQVTKLSLAHRILDEHQIERHYTMGNLQELYRYDPIPKSEWKIPKIPKDDLFAEILANNRDIIVGYHEHDSLLENKEEEELTEEDRRAAWEDYEKEKLTPEHPLLAVNGVQVPFPTISSINCEGLQIVQRYKQGIDAFRTTQNFKDVQKENQLCRIVDVRTLQDESWERRKLLEIGRSLGMRPFEGENIERFCKRIENTFKTICQRRSMYK